MGRIHLLDDAVINKIAAGEVVERPASVVKELVENSLDAGAKSVVIELRDGGILGITVSDDGVGMAADDALLAVRRHATSKIASADDLFRVASMGFRGEALASIASVSYFGLSTRQMEASVGVRLTSGGGENWQQTDWHGPTGTMISVDDLFFNIPARKKFLKAASAELAQISELCEAIALSRPDINLTLKNNNKEKFRAYAVAGQPTTAPYWGEKALRERAAQIWSQAEVDGLSYAKGESQYGQMEALVSSPGFERATSKRMHTFVNGRWVKDKTLHYGVMRGYDSHLLKGRFPIALVFLQMDPSLIDVNVHPAKTQLRFQYASEVGALIASTIRQCLRSGAWAKPFSPASAFAKATADRSAFGEVGADRSSFGKVGADRSSFGKVGADRSALGEIGADRSAFGKVGADRSAFGKVGADRSSFGKVGADRSSFGKVGADRSAVALAKADEVRGVITTPKDMPERSEGGAGRRSGDLLESSWKVRSTDPLTGPAPLRRGDEGVNSASSFAKPTAGIKPTTDKPLQRGDDVRFIDWDELEWIGVFLNCYIFFSYREKLLAIDQHAFHERIIFERLSKDHSLLMQVQPLLVFELVDLPPSLVSSLAEKQDGLRECGIDFSIISETEVEVRSLPSLLAGKDITKLLVELADLDFVVGDEPAHLLSCQPILASIACHSAVRAGEALGRKDWDILLQEASEVDFFLNCPHGRRVFRWFDKKQVESWFDR